MASIGSLSSSTSTSIRGYGGLASGLDRDELIEGMTIGTTTKINKQEQKKQQIEWMQEAVRSISDKMISFHGKYTETLTSPTNLFSSMLWGRNKITTSGTNSSKISVSGTASSADAITIMGVKNKAENAKWTSSGRVSASSSFESENIKFTDPNTADGKFLKEELAGKTIEFKYGGSNYYITLSKSDTYNYKAANGKSAEENIASAINDLLSKQTTSDNKKLSDIVKATGKDGQIVFEDVGSGGNALELTGGSALHLLGLADEKGENIKNEGKFTTKDEDGNTVATPLAGTISSGITTPQTFSEYIAGKSLTFSYNGSTGTVTMPGAEELDARAQEIFAAGKASDENNATVKAIAESIQQQLNTTFGKGRIKVSEENGKLSFKTTLPSDDSNNPTSDPSSTLSITGGDIELVGAEKGVLGLHAGQTTRTELGAKITGDTFAHLRKYVSTEAVKDKDGNPVKDTDGNIVYKKGFKLNGEFVEVKDGATTKDIMDAINNSKANVTVTYLEAADKFTFTSNDKGASGVVDFSGNDAETLEALEKTFGLDLVDYQDAFKDSDGTILYEREDNGKTVYQNKDGQTLYEKQGDKIVKADGSGSEGMLESTKVAQAKATLSSRGKDAVVAVRYAGSDETVEITRDSNTFTVDGLTIAIKGTFGYEKDENGQLKRIEDEDKALEAAVEINASVDTDKLVDTIKSFVDEYNAIVDMVNSELTTKHERDYTPLSSEQKSELSDDEIEKWETKAKAGLLYGDSDLRSLSMDLRTVATSYVAQLEKIGISVSSTYSDNGKLSVDESKLRAALETDPDNVEKLFTSKAGVDENGKPVYNGIATNLKNVMEKYVKTSGPMEDKGVLIRKAGSKSSAMSMTQNTYYDQISAIDKLITQLNERLKTERDRYIKQFTSLETLISQMNSQSSYLSSMSGY